MMQYPELSEIDRELYKQQIDYQREQSRETYPSQWASRILSRIRMRSKEKSIYCDLTKEDLVIPELCPILGIQLIINKDRMRDNSPSVDRIDNTKGYTKDNIHIISWRANRIKSDASVEELRKIVSYLEKLQ